MDSIKCVYGRLRFDVEVEIENILFIIIFWEKLSLYYEYESSRWQHH